MWLIACQDGDEPAMWLGERWREAGVASVEVITASELVYGANWEHRVNSHRTETTLTFTDGRTIHSGEVAAVLNRLLWVSAEGYSRASAEDREYATIELQALVVSWLEGLGERVMNRPMPPSAGVAWRPLSHWRALAAMAGVNVCPYSSRGDAVPGGQTSAVERPCTGVLIIDGRPLGDALPARLSVDPAALASAVGLDVFEAIFAESESVGWELVDINPMPHLPGYSELVARQLAAAFRAREERAA